MKIRPKMTTSTFVYNHGDLDFSYLNFLSRLKSFYDSGIQEFKIKFIDRNENCVTLDLKLEESPKMRVSGQGQNMEFDLNRRSDRIEKILNLWGKVIKAEERKYIESSDYYETLTDPSPRVIEKVFNATGEARKAGKRNVLMKIEHGFDIRPLSTSLSPLSCGEEASISGQFGYKYGFSVFNFEYEIDENGLVINENDQLMGKQSLAPFNYQVLTVGARFTGTIRCSSECCENLPDRVVRKEPKPRVPQKNHLASFCTNFPHNCADQEARRVPRLTISFNLEKLKEQLKGRMMQQPWQGPESWREGSGIFNIYALGNDTVHQTVDAKFTLKGQEITGSGTLFYYPNDLPRFPQFGGYHAYARIEFPGSDKYSNLYQGVIKDVRVAVSMGGLSLGSFLMDLDFDHRTHCDIVSYTDNPPWHPVLIGQ